MAASSSSPSLPRQLLQLVLSRLDAALYRPSRSTNPAAAAYYCQGQAGHGTDIAAAAAIVPRQVDAAAGQLLAGRIGAPPKGRPGEPREGGGGHVHATPATVRVVKRGPRPPGPPAEGPGGHGGIVHATPASAASS